MRIKRVEIIGFKSFCDRAVVQIGESITGVVGPNGCGKSNIVDAIRWCMGEQSAKHLRGKAMEDVIFAGSESRGPSPMAEVSLTFDDVGFSHETLELTRVAQAEAQDAILDALPDAPEGDDEGGEAGEPDEVALEAAPETGNAGTWIDAEGNKIASPTEEVAKLLADAPPAFEFSHYTEVTITRRLYRDGISQYFINKTLCRLRDITDFFLGTGVGTKAYAIIEQGRIGQIVSARPQERRAIIEEAAGITKFKAKKKAAERKLDQTRQNLMRVSDIVSELDKRMGTLRRQAQKAERYRKYRGEMRDIELWKAAHRWLELKGEATLVGGRLGEVRTELETARTDWTIKDATVVAERADLVIEERRLVGVQEKVYELDNTIRLGDSKIGFELREADDLDHRVAGARSEIEEVLHQRERGQLELTARSTELAALEAEVARESSEVETREAAAGEARQMLANAEGILDDARTQIADRKTAVATSQAQLEALAHRKGEANGRLERVTTETEQHATRSKELEREGRRVDGALAELRQTRLDLGSQGDGFVMRKETLGEQVARGEAEVETLRTELHRRRSRLVSLEEIQERYEGFARGTRAVMQGADAFTDRVAEPDPIRGVVADVVRAPELLEVAVEAALGDRLGGVLVADATVGVAAIGYLKQEGGGRSAFVPLTAKPSAEVSSARRAAAREADSGAYRATDDGADSAGVPEPVRDDKLGEARFQSAAMRSLAMQFEGEGNTGHDLSEPQVSPFGATPAHGASVTDTGGIPVATDDLRGDRAVDASTTTDTLNERIAAALSRAASERIAKAFDVGYLADPQLAALGAQLRARSLFADAMLADAQLASTGAGRVRSLHADVLHADTMQTDALLADARLAATGAGHRATSLLADAILADPLHDGLEADAQLATSGAALRARSLFEDAMLADPLHAGLDADAQLATIGAALRAHSLLADAMVADAMRADIDTARSISEGADGSTQLAALHADSQHADHESPSALAIPLHADVQLARELLAEVLSDPDALEADLQLARELLAEAEFIHLPAVAVDLHEPQLTGSDLDAAWLASPEEIAVTSSLDADAQLANSGFARRAQSLRAEAELAIDQGAAQHADSQLVDSVLAEWAHHAWLAASGAAQSTTVHADGTDAWHTDAAAERAAAERAADDTHGDRASTDVPASSRLIHVAPAPAMERRRPFEFEDRSQLMGAIVSATRDEAGRGGDDVVGEGVLGRMIDLVGFTEGYEQVGRRLLGRTVVVDHLQRALDLHERGVTDRLVTLEGDIVDEDGVVAGGSREAQGAGVLAQKREIRDLHEIVGRLEHDLSEAMQRLITAKTELSQVSKAIDGLRAQVHQGEVAIVGHEKDDARVRSELDRHRDRLGHLGNEQLELESRLAAILSDEGTQQERLQRAGIDQRELEQLQLDTISQVAAHRDRLEELGHVLTEARIRAAQLEAQRSAVESATLRLMQTDGELAARAERLSAECEESARRASTLREDCEKLAAELASTREERASESQTMEQGRIAYQARLETLSEIELAARDLRTRADALGNELNQLELRHGQITMTRQVIEEQASERYQVDLVDVLPDYHQRMQVTDVEEGRLTELRELIERMGTDINLTAIDEFADVSSRFEFLSAQKIDLERAVDQLQKAIDKINKTSRKLFKDTFAAVNATFKEVFPRLFRGGHAALSLSVPTPGVDGEGAPKPRTEDDLLDAGIDIMAQPPGKKNVTIDQLSGGEKALTAVALVFSIFLIKPSPFCILDEVDAPLDESNVDRYNEIVREMTDRSQFIVITHNKRTMESADILYGVTMQEPGVSKLVSVNLSRVGAGDRPVSSKPVATSVVAI